MIRRTVTALCAALLAASSLIVAQPVHASPIPTLLAGDHILVAVEPLLETLEIQYHLTDGRLSVGDHAYTSPMVSDAGLHYAEPRAIAAFLNLQISYPRGVITF